MVQKSRLEQIIIRDGYVCTFLTNLCQENVYFKRKRNFLQAYMPNAENLYKGAAWNSSKRDKGFWTVFPVFFFQNNFRFTSYKYVTFGYPKVHRPTYLIVISFDDLAPNRPKIRIWYGILSWINQLTAIDLNMLARICRQQCILLFLLPLGSFSQR